MVGWRLGRLEILFPEALAERLSGSECDALLAHELAHVGRRDHWVRFLELAAASAFWWHPVSWWARRGLRRAEERACDERVLASMPGLARTYATAMIETVDFLASPGAVRSPVLVSGLDEFTNLKERLTMILDDPSVKRVSRWQRWALALAAGVVFVSVPTWAANRPTESDARPRA
jgi:beta-lactamase regulating signal transducer with metallopeptidase domain